MIRAVLFDFGQTLVDSADGFRRAEKQAQDRIFQHLGLTNREEFMTQYRHVRSQCHARSQLSRVAIWHEVYWYFCRAAAAEPLLRQWESDYWHTVKEHTTAFPETERVLQALHPRYRLALISNTQGQVTDAQHRLTEYPQLESFFDEIVIAGENSLAPKPDPRPFRQCLERLGVPPAQAVYVGDDWRNDVGGARDAGLRPVWIKHHLVQRHWPEVDSAGVPVITSLEPLLDLDRLLAAPDATF